MTTDAASAKYVSEKIRWFFTDESSRYELADIKFLCRTTTDNIQNWVRRGMLTPDETNGRRIYGPFTTASAKVATLLVDIGMSPAVAFEVAGIVNAAVMSWYGERKWKPGDKLPTFDKDIRGKIAVITWAPTKARQAWVEIIAPNELGKLLNKTGPFPHAVIPIGRTWLDLAEHADDRKTNWRKRS